MTGEEYAARLKSLADAATNNASLTVIVPAANRLLANIKNRIQVEGENTNGGKIGQYSTKPLYATQPQFVKKSSFKPQGKAGKGKKENGSARKSMYLPGGYKQLRDVQGRPTDKVNMTYRGDLMLSYVMQQTAQAVLLGLNSELEAKKREGNEKRFGRIFYATKEEIGEYNTEVSQAAKDLTLKILKG